MANKPTSTGTPLDESPANNTVEFGGGNWGSAVATAHHAKQQASTCPVTDQSYVPASPSYPPASPPYTPVSPSYAPLGGGTSKESVWLPSQDVSPADIGAPAWPFMCDPPVFVGSNGTYKWPDRPANGRGRGNPRRTGKPRPVDRRPRPPPNATAPRSRVPPIANQGTQRVAALRMALQQGGGGQLPAGPVAPPAAPQPPQPPQGAPVQVLPGPPAVAGGPQVVSNRAMSTYDLQLDDDLPPLQVDVLPCVLRPITGGHLPCHGASCRPCAAEHFKGIGSDPTLLTNCSPGEQSTCTRCGLLSEAVRVGALFAPVRHHYARASVVAWKREAKYLAAREVVFNKRTAHTPRQVFLAVERKLKQMGCGEELSTYLATQAASDSISLSATEWDMLGKLERGEMSDVILRQRRWYEGGGRRTGEAVGRAMVVAAPIAASVAVARAPRYGLPIVLGLGALAWCTRFNPFRFILQQMDQAVGAWNGVEPLPHH